MFLLFCLREEAVPVSPSNPYLDPAKAIETLDGLIMRARSPLRRQESEAILKQARNYHRFHVAEIKDDRSRLFRQNTEDILLRLLDLYEVFATNGWALEEVAEKVGEIFKAFDHFGDYAKEKGVAKVLDALRRLVKQDQGFDLVRCHLASMLSLALSEPINWSFIVKIRFIFDDLIEKDQEFSCIETVLSLLNNHRDASVRNIAVEILSTLAQSQSDDSSDASSEEEGNEVEAQNTPSPSVRRRLFVGHVEVCAESPPSAFHVEAQRASLSLSLSPILKSEPTSPQREERSVRSLDLEGETPLTPQCIDLIKDPELVSQAPDASDQGSVDELPSPLPLELERSDLADSAKKTAFENRTALKQNGGQVKKVQFIVDKTLLGNKKQKAHKVKATPMPVRWHPIEGDKENKGVTVNAPLDDVVTSLPKTPAVTKIHVGIGGSQRLQAAESVAMSPPTPPLVRIHI